MPDGATSSFVLYSVKYGDATSHHKKQNIGKWRDQYFGLFGSVKYGDEKMPSQEKKMPDGATRTSVYSVFGEIRRWTNAITRRKTWPNGVTSTSV